MQSNACEAKNGQQTAEEICRQIGQPHSSHDPQARSEESGLSETHYYKILHNDKKASCEIAQGHYISKSPIFLPPEKRKEIECYAYVQKIDKKTC